VGIRLLAGRAGTGKTWWCQEQIRRALDQHLIDGPRLMMLVPEQAGLQMERCLLATSAAQALGRCEVLSFRRLARRILNESVGPTPTALTATGRQMALRHLLGRCHRSLREFGKVSQRAGFITELSRGVAELLQECVSVEQFEACASDAADAGDAGAARLHDVALLYRAYLEYLSDQRVDPEGVLDLARARLGRAAWLAGSHIWIDGFAGFTRQQVRMITALGAVASQVDIALLLDPDRGASTTPDAQPDGLSLFARTEQTWASLLKAFVEAGLAIEPMVRLGGEAPPRFARSRSLGELERRLFASEPTAERGDHRRDAGATVLPREASEPDAGVRLVEARDRRTEVDAAIRIIVDLVQREDNPMRYREIAIAVRDLTPYHDLISAGLQRHGIPFFIDRRRPTYHHPLVQAIRAALGIMGGGRFDESIARLLKCGLSGLTDGEADGLENHCLEFGLWTSQAWDEPWTTPEASAEVEKARCGLRDHMGEWWPTDPTHRGRPKARVWAARLVGLLERLGVAERLADWSEQAEARDDLDEAAEHEHVWADWVSLLEELVAALGDEQMTGRQFRAVLESGLSEFTLGLTPPTVDQLLVGSIERSRHPAVRAMFVLGFCDGAFPARAATEAILGDRELAYLAERNVPVGRTRKQRIIDERLLAYIAVTRPSELLWVGCPQSDDEGRPIAASPYWPALCAALPRAVVETAEPRDIEAISTSGDLAAALATQLRSWVEGRLDDGAAAAWLTLYDWARSTDRADIREVVEPALTALGSIPDARLSASATRMLWPGPYRTSVTHLEKFAGCPFRHFAERGLRLEPRRVHEVGAADYGKLYHTILEQFVNELIETGSQLADLSPGNIAKQLEGLCDRVVPAYATEWNLGLTERAGVQRRSMAELPDAVKGQKSTVGTTPLELGMAEKAFGEGGDSLPALVLTTSHGVEVLVRGRIDRVDFVDVGEASLAVVFDYKRSLNRRLRLDEVFHGLALQLLAYLLVLRDGGGPSGLGTVIPGGAFYVPLIGPFERLQHPSEADADGFDPFGVFKPRGVVDFDWIDRLDPGMSSGADSAFAAVRKKDGGISRLDASDAVEDGALPRLLGHVRGKMTELAEAWIGGEIAVRPARLGKDLACSYCPMRSVCRFEYATHAVRMLSPMKRSVVLSALAAEGRADG
jgi:ATP-dependent helicase/nuclease subunit B